MPAGMLAILSVAAVVLWLAPIPVRQEPPAAPEERASEASVDVVPGSPGAGPEAPAPTRASPASAPAASGRSAGRSDEGSGADPWEPRAGTGEVAAPSGSGDAFGVAIAEGLAAVDAGDWQAARGAFARAAEIRPDSPEPAAGLARLEAATSRIALEELLGRARERETSEAWGEAAAAYRSALDIDPSLTAARDGLRSSEARQLLSDRIAYHLDNPDRLSADAVLSEVERLLDSARGVAPAGPRHREEVAALAALVDRVRSPVRVALVSDALTEVTVFQVGRLGTFSRRELELRPGTYTVVGSRAGYRDVRRQLTVAPGGGAEPFEIRCEEKI